MKDLVLLGGGHSHISVLKRLAMRPVAGLRITLVTRDVHTPYSGMLPGLIAGHYDYDEAHIDLRRLALFAGARIYRAEVSGLDPEGKQVMSAGRPPLPYDVLSINTGSRPATSSIPGAAEYALPVKPIDEFLTGWKTLVERALAAGDELTVAVTGGGAGGVELALATQYRLRQRLAQVGRQDMRLHYHLVTDSREILPTHNARVRKKLERVLRERGIRVHAEHRVVRIDARALHCANGATLKADAVLWVTQASAPSWARESGLATDELGFIQVNDCLQSVSHPDVFAAGDIAAMVGHPRPKSGVFAVRQGPPLARNLRRYLLGRRLKRFIPQTKFLGLIGTGDKYAVASRAGWSLEGAWVWRVKDRIDRRFMRSFNELPEMLEESRAKVTPGLAGQEALNEISGTAMRCGGCGAKVGSTVLARVVNRLQPISREDVLIGLQEPDDAAVVEVPEGKVLVQSVDYFRAFLDDPYLFGAIAANHSLGDIFAMGAEPQSAMAIATLPYGRERVVEEQLYQLMYGALEVLNAAGAALVGGHSSEGAELSFGLSATGLASRERLLRKGGIRPGDRLLLTKPLGTGTLFAADMRHRAKGRWVHGAIECMLVSNRAAADCLREHGARACTDVTGFGLLGHLVEMVRASQVDVELRLDALPLLEGALDTLRAGIFSTLQPQNLRLRRAIRNLADAASHAHYPILFDPQTAGGLLAGVPEPRAEACLARLRALGYAHAAMIGRVLERGDTLEPIHLGTTRGGVAS